MDVTPRLQVIVQFYRRQHRMPALRDLQQLYGFKSVRAAEKVAGKLLALGLVGKDPTGKLLPTRYFRETRVLGAVEAGFPSPAEEELGDTMDLDEFLIKNKEATYILK